MTSIAIYLSFIGAWGHYRPSRHWPLAPSTAAMRYSNYWSWAALLLSALLLCAAKGTLTGILLFIVMLPLVYALLILAANAPSALRRSMLLLFHLLCLMGIALS